MGLLALPSLTGPAIAHADTDDVPFYVMGGSGLSTPSQELIDTLQSLYFPSAANFAGQPTFSNVDPVALTTPEQFYPVTGVYQETLANSVAQGVQIPGQRDLTDPQRRRPGRHLRRLPKRGHRIPGDGAAGADRSFGERNLCAHRGFDESERRDLRTFCRSDLSTLGIDFYGATPADDFTTTIYTLEYDGYADFPKYPLDILSDLNAIEGINVVHGDYLT